MSAPEEKVSPMLAQYLKIKEKYKDYVVFFRLGDFYEMFYDEAEKISRELELTLTARAGVPMCGVPYHACEVYLKKLIDKGYKVALCEQMQDPATTKGLVERDVIRLVTPGTLYEDSMLDEARNNYVTTQGSGNLQIKYNNQNGLTVGGRYSMSGGEFKVTLPIIPLKTLEIGDGSEITWSGEVFNPDLNITAFERVTSSVSLDDNNMVPVPFDVGVKVTNTLEKMNLSFIMSSPENTTIQNELNALNPEDMNRYAVTMLITGSYAGNKNITAANALSSFIDAKINDIAGTAMKGVNVNMGINDATNAETGSTYKNYSFSFSKRFWNDRMTIVIGGEVNSGDRPRGSNGFINNASLEWKVNNAGNRFLRVFYDKNYESILEGEITETGAGYIYKRKLDNLKDLFIFRKKKEEEKKDGKEREEKMPEQSKKD